MLWSNIVELYTIYTLYRNDFDRPLSSSSLKWAQSTSFSLALSFFLKKKCCVSPFFRSRFLHISSFLLQLQNKNENLFECESIDCNNSSSTGCVQKIEQIRGYTALASVSFFLFRFIRSMPYSYALHEDQFSSIQLNLYLLVVVTAVLKKERKGLYFVPLSDNICKQ